MKPHTAMLGFTLIAALIGSGGCSRSDTVMEGIVYSVEYQSPGAMRTYIQRQKRDSYGRPNEVYGRLTPDFLILTFPRVKNSTAEVIPVSQLVSLQFGDGGIKYNADSPGSALTTPAAAKPAATPVTTP